MTRAHLLDAVIGSELPTLQSGAELAAFEATPYAQRIRAQSTYEALRLGATANPDAAAIHFLSKADPEETPLTISHSQFFARVTQAANLFHQLGVGPEDVVSVLMPLLPQAFCALFGAQAAGIANPVNPMLSAEQLAEILRAARTRVLVTLGPVPGSDIYAKVLQIKDRLPELTAILVVHGAGVDAPGMHDFDAMLAGCPADRLTSGRCIRHDDTAGYFHTGGTTGTPKLVRHTHGNQVYQAWALGLMLPHGGSPLLYGLPLFHVGGALTQALATLAGGSALVVLGPAGWREPEAIPNVWRLVERYKPTTLAAVPTVLAAAIQVPVNGADISSLRYAAGGGSAVPVAVSQAYAQLLGLPMIEVYGMTETASALTGAYPHRPLRLGSAGHALPYSRVRVVKFDRDGLAVGDCAPNEIGIVAMSGPGVFSGYLNEAHNRDAFVEPGWVNSGDLGRIDDDGSLWLTGRAKDLIIRGSHNIDPTAIEEVFFQHPGVALAAVVGEPDAYAGELPVAFVQLRPGTAVDAAELIAFLRERTPERAAVPVHVYFIDAIPLTAVGKVFKPALRFEATKRAVTRMLAELAPPPAEIVVDVGPHAEHGSLVTVRVGGVDIGARESVARQIDSRLDPLTTRHEIVWF
ncbi:acyl-CoA synthetase [Cupriavidus sp. BIS7]|uniref:acyl-CoA synthetase n=1 Tax=Cupriavidus sp. BIS7 TaxID=1217718 RepID=UPI0002F6C95A|nr:acyl-CoA synthetase [Cupriavidus sp. BIS7]